MTQLAMDVFSQRGKRCPDLLEHIRGFDRVGLRTEVFEDRGLTYYVNDFWTARQRQSNRLHEISYRACFKAQLPEFFINLLTEDGDVVYDPFMGRGTTPIQAALMGRQPAGNDINPLSELLTRPRLFPPPLTEVVTRLQEIQWPASEHEPHDLLTFYHPRTLAQIVTLRDWLLKREAAGTLDRVDDWIRMVALNRLTGHSSGFFSVYTLPPNQAVSVDSQRKINERRNQIPPVRDVPTIILKKSRVLLSQVPNVLRQITPILSTSEASNTPQLEDGSVDLVVTSPPFLDIVQYAKDNWLRCWFAGIDSRTVPVAMHRTVEDWTAFVRKTFYELGRTVRSGGHVCFEVGEVRNGTVSLEHYVAKAVEGLQFETMGVVINQQEFTKTSNCWGIKNNTSGTNTNRIVVLRRL